MLLEVAEISERRAGDAGLAFEAMRRAFAIAPGDERVEGEIERLAEAADTWPGLHRRVPRRHRGSRAQATRRSS